MGSFFAADGVDSAGPLDPSLFMADPGPADRGQPTYFYPRRQQFVFGVVVPAGFVGKELVWSVSHNGETRTAVGTLERENIWSVDEGVWSANRGRGTGGRTEVEYANAVPEVRLVGLEGQLNTGVGIPISLRVLHPMMGYLALMREIEGVRWKDCPMIYPRLVAE